MKLYILVFMLLFIIPLSFMLKKSIQKVIDVLYKMEIRELLLYMGGLYIGLSFMLSINMQGLNLVPLSIMFIIGASYVFYAKSHHFDKLWLIQFCRDYFESQSPAVMNLKDTNTNKILHYTEIYEDIVIVEDLTDVKSNIIFRVIDFAFIKEYCLRWANENIELESVPHFMSLVAGNEITTKVRLKSRAKKSKELTYRPLFELFDQISYLGVNRLVSDERNSFINFICSNFIKGEKILSNKTLNPRFSTWKNSCNIGEKHPYTSLGWT